jgi:2-hydroxychromene-2-carboxylate isomerase
VASHIASLGLSEQGYRDYLAGEGKRAFAAAQAEAVADKVFGVPLFVFNGEPFWGHDRIPFLEHRLAEAGLARDASQRVSPEPRAATA